MSDRLEHVRTVYDAFASGDRSAIEASFTEDFRFSSPLDVDLDRAGYFERCWPGSGRGQEFEFVRLIESGDEVVVTYETTRPDRYRWTPRLSNVGSQGGYRMLAIGGPSHRFSMRTRHISGNTRQRTISPRPEANSSRSTLTAPMLALIDNR